MKGMLLLAAAVLVLWQSGVMNDMARCRSMRTGEIGPEANWETDGKGRLWLSTTARASGRVELQCRIPVPSTANGVVLEIDSAAVTFAGAESSDLGSGVIIQAPEIRWELLRVAGETWAETGNRRSRIGDGGPELVLTITAIDRSTRVPMRVDIRGLRVIGTEPVGQASPPAR